MIKHSLPYITGMGYRYICNFKYDEFEKFKIEDIIQFDNMKIFVKADMLLEFQTIILPYINKKFILYSHNSDFCVDFRYKNILNNSNLIVWYAQNVNIEHDKIKSIPIGLANRRWDHGNIEIFEKVLNMKNKKENLIYCNFDVKTNMKERLHCENNIYPIKNNKRVSFEEYLIQLSKSYFVISPNGNGIDCHKHWESMYFNTIPIVTDSINIKNLKNDYPFIIIDDWSNFKKLELNKELYENMIQKLDKNKLYL